MSSDEEDVDLNEDATAQLDNASDDGTDMMETDGNIFNTVVSDHAPAIP